MKSVKKNRHMKRSKAQPFPAFKSSTAITNPYRAPPKGLKEGQYRSKETIRRLNMYKEKPNFAKMKIQPTEPARINPDRRWFGNTRVLTQEQMENFRNELGNVKNDPRTHIIKRSKLPMSLLTDSNIKVDNSKILTLESMEETFGKKSRRKRPKLSVSTIEELVNDVNSRVYDSNKDKSLTVIGDHVSEETPNVIFKKGTSKRIWAELYKVIDCSDVVVQVIDARDPMGTRCLRLENYIRKHKSSKVLVLLMNKCDLVPSWVTAAWIKHLNRDITTVAFHASVTNPFGKNTFIQLLKQYSQLFKDRKHFSVGFIGYPNVGKSSVINTLKGNKSCKTAPIPGETRIWQYVCLTKRIHLIDCPGVTPVEGDESDKILKGAIRVERIPDPENYIYKVLKVLQKEALVHRYGVKDFNEENFLELVAAKFGKYKKGKIPDVSIAARIGERGCECVNKHVLVLYDFQRGRLPFYTEPPKEESKVDPSEEIRKHLEEIDSYEFPKTAEIEEEDVENICNLKETEEEGENKEEKEEESSESQLESYPHNTLSQIPNLDYNAFLT
ncbi:Ngp [Theileria orientalis strain Shintoku]|uniref:Nucleolar GTP-binding protein 2 n=1 Tax=Theileria orientalis strain Shintoku TaxID=869250 RepID=J4DPB6_THEOR|nr:Ngp [Theileria orientalis strain Shintoku]BAM40419.1 Ngp [Theileria orientalis strain Shintoku]|eukprot:XP_009690720.1 Ngp [Theileria orientalis strain Shintoku]